MSLKSAIIPLAILLFSISCTTTKKTTTVTVNTSTDTTKKAIGKLKPYKEVITGKAITDSGLIIVHQIEGNYFFEIPDSLLNKDILIVNRISKAAAAVRPAYGMLGYAGDYIGESVVQLVKGPDHKLFIRRTYYLDYASDSSANGMYRSVYNSSLQPIVASFDIKTVSPDGASSVIDVTEYLKGDNDILFFDPQAKKAFGLGELQTDKSYTESIQSFPLNTEIKTVKTYSIGDAGFTYELNSSLVLLPAVPMRPRSFDERVGYFARGYRDFDFPQAAKPSYRITRWRLEPKAEDEENYQRGELVEPKKPIVFYIDPATPKKWVPYLIQGVNDWQKAFEKAGFKKAIYALEAPAGDSTWSLEDARHNAIIYKASFVQNASGPQVTDPRSGEVIESHINWYHNVQQLLHDWYFIQASPNDPRARKIAFDDSLMGELIRFVCAHEVGHTLGLQHDFIASSTVPTDSLRSKNYIAKNGHTPSIMDYARFNYVAQPEDSIAVKDLIPHIGVYDNWAIEWGYRWLPELKIREEEKSYMNQWIISQLAKDKRLVFVKENPADPRCQAEDLGDNAMTAGYYGIKNLQRVIAHLKQWSSSPNENYTNYLQLTLGVLRQYQQYIKLVQKNIGGFMVTPKTIEQGGAVTGFVDRKTQQAAVQFLHDELFTTPNWLNEKESFPLIGGGQIITIYKMQESVLHNLVSGAMYNWLVLNETNQPKKEAYSFNDLLNDLEAGIWKELKTHQNIDIYRQTVQKIYVVKLTDFIRLNMPGDFGMLNGCTIAAMHIKGLYEKIRAALPGYTDPFIRAHLEDLRDRLKLEMEEQKTKYNSMESHTFKNNGIINADNLNRNKIKLLSTDIFTDDEKRKTRTCWETSDDNQGD